MLNADIVSTINQLVIYGVLFIVAILLLRRVFVVIPQNMAYVVERLGKYNRTLTGGFNIIVPFMERVAYKHSLKESVTDTAEQTAITKDNVNVNIDGVLFTRVTDPRLASYGVESWKEAVTQLAQTSMRSEIGKLQLDATLESRDIINTAITKAMDDACASWGVKILRFEIKHIDPPESIRDEMEKQLGAERSRRAEVTTAEGYQTSQILRAEGDKQSRILRAEGDAAAVQIEAEAQANAISAISTAINTEGGEAAVAQQLGSEYIAAFRDLARESTIALVPSDTSDIAGTVAKGYTAFNALKSQMGLGASTVPEERPMPPRSQPLTSSLSETST